MTKALTKEVEQDTHLDGVQGSDEKQTEAYKGTAKGVSESVTKKSAKSISRVAGSASKQASAVRGLTMDDLLEGYEVTALKAGDVVEGMVTSVKKHEVLVDMGDRGIGVIFRREVGGNNLVEGEAITASIVDPELDEGYALLSMKRAAKDRGWGELQRLFESQEITDVIAYDANRGGLLV